MVAWVHDDVPLLATESIIDSIRLNRRRYLVRWDIDFACTNHHLIDLGASAKENVLQIKIKDRDSAAVDGGC
jgi:hypothetical protein